jgi:hypothetical protein
MIIILCSMFLLEKNCPSSVCKKIRLSVKSSGSIFLESAGIDNTRLSLEKSRLKDNMARRRPKRPTNDRALYYSAGRSFSTHDTRPYETIRDDHGATYRLSFLDSPSNMFWKGVRTRKSTESFNKILRPGCHQQRK